MCLRVKPLNHLQILQPSPPFNTLTNTNMQLVRAPFQQGACVRRAPVRASVVRCNVSFKPEQAMAAVVAAGVLLVSELHGS